MQIFSREDRFCLLISYSIENEFKIRKAPVIKFIVSNINICCSGSLNNHGDHVN